MSAARSLSSLILGGYEPVEDGKRFGQQTIAAAQDLFFLTVKSTAKKVLEDLAAASLSSFTAAGLDRFLLPNPLVPFLTGESQAARSEIYCTLEQFKFRQELFAWSKRWFIDADWCRNWALYQLLMWAQIPFDKEHLSITPLGTGGVLYSCPDPPAGIPLCFPELQTKDEYLDKIEAEAWGLLKANALLMSGDFSCLADYIKTIRKKAGEHYDQVDNEPSLRRAPEFRSLRTRLIWTVEYQVGELSIQEIADAHSAPYRTVADGISEALDLIELVKRPSASVGRKQGTKAPRKLSAREAANKKARLSKFIKAYYEVSEPENKAAMARAIGLKSVNYFRRVWIPELIKEVGCEDYNELIQRSTVDAIRKRHSLIVRI